MPRQSPLDKKALRVRVVEGLRKICPSFDQLPRKEKRATVKEAVRAVRFMQENGQKFNGLDGMSQSVRVGLGKVPSGVMTVDDMLTMVRENKNTLFGLTAHRCSRRLSDPLLTYVDEQLDDFILDRLVASPTQKLTPSKRKWMPSTYFRAELLRALKFPHLSVRAFCELLTHERKYAEERAFCGILYKSKGSTFSHSSLSVFRSSLTLEMRLNVMTYVTALLLRSGRLGTAGVFAVDSTDVATCQNPRPLDKVEMPDGSFIRFYADLDSDCGARRKKRDKSERFVGYRVHTLCAVDVETKIAFPVLSLAVAANHHDSQVLEPLVAVAQAVGLNIKLLLGDDAYSDVSKQRELLTRDDIMLLTPDHEDALVPANVNADDGQVFFSPECPFPMAWRGYDKDEQGHLFSCSDDRSECILQHLCPKERLIDLDNGLMRAIPNCVDASDKAMDLRKVTERPFNLMKHLDGLEPCRMRNIRSVSSQVTFSQIAGIFRAMAGIRSAKPEDVASTGHNPIQEVLNFANG